MGQLPFLTTGELQAQGGAAVESDIPCSVWPATGANSAAGRAYDHEAEVPLSYGEFFGPANLKFVIDGTIYSVVEWQEHQFYPHVSLLLRRMDAGG